MDNFDEINIKFIIKAMEESNKEPTLYNKSGKPKGYYAERVKKAKQKPENEKRRNDPKNLEQLACMRAIRKQNLLKRKAELPKKKVEHEAVKIKNALELERLKQKYEEDEKKKQKEKHHKELMDMIQEQFNNFNFANKKPEEIEKEI